MKTVHWLAIALLLAMFTMIGVFSTVALVKQAVAQALDDKFPEIEHDEVQTDD